MAKEILITNPDVKILHRQGVFFAGVLSGTTAPVQLVEADIILLTLFCKGGNNAAVAKQLQIGKASQYLQIVPSLEYITGRIKQLQQAHVLIEGTKHKVINKPFIVDSKNLPVVSAESRLRLTSNFALEPSASGFTCWSAGSGKNHLLSIELILLLIAFSNGKIVADVLSAQSQIGDATSRSHYINWLVKQRLLVHIEATPVVSQKQTQQTAAKNSSSPRWQDIKPDGRIPVYFAPHMPNHYPLALGMIYAYISKYNNGALLKKYQLLPLTFQKPQDLLNGPYKKFGKGVWLFSNYMWSIDVNIQLSDTVKKHDNGNITIHGGPSTPGYEHACADFMAQHASIDIAVRGEGEIATAKILEALCPDDEVTLHYDPQPLNNVSGLTFRNTDVTSSTLVRTQERDRVKVLDDIPSPYSSGVFDVYDAPVDAAIIESNRGCPFGCTFCDWGSATKQKVRKFDLDRVKEEIEWIGQNGIRILWVADANFGMYDRDIELAQWICDVKDKYGFPNEVVVNYTKNATKRLAEIIKVFAAGGIISQGIISIQTTDETTLEIINRKNIKTTKYDELTQIFADEGLPLSTDLMMGLPGITVEAFERDLQRYIDVDVTAKAYPTQLLPNSPMADPEYLKKYNIKVDKNDYLISCNSYTEPELNDMKQLYSYYVMADGYSILRYVVRYLQWDHKIPALTFLQKLKNNTEQRPKQYPSITWVFKFFPTDKNIPGGWKQFYYEIAEFTKDSFGIKKDATFETVLNVNALTMPDDTMTYPATISLQYDFVAYFKAHVGKSDSDANPLSSYSKATFSVDDPELLANPDTDISQYDTHQYFWELRSEIARNQSAPHASKEK